jgi:hypothetical protein
LPSEVYRSPDQVTTAPAYLAMEGELYCPWLEAEVAAVYFGRGTTHLYRPYQ